MTLINAPTTFFLVHLNLPWLKDEDLPDLVCDKAQIMNVFLGWRTADDSSNLLSSHGSVADVNQHLLCNHLFDRAWNHPCAPLGISSSCQIQECWCKLNSISVFFIEVRTKSKKSTFGRWRRRERHSTRWSSAIPAWSCDLRGQLIATLVTTVSAEWIITACGSELASVLGTTSMHVFDPHYF